MPFHASGIDAVVVSQTEECYEEIEALLSQLRALRRAQPKGGKGSVAAGTKPREPAISHRAAIAEPSPPIISEAEAAFRRALRKPISFQFKGTSLKEVIAALKKKTGLSIVMDLRPLDAPPEKKLPDLLGGSAKRHRVQVSLDTPITAAAAEITLESALDQMLRPLELTWTYDGGCLLITTVEQEEELRGTRCYDVADLPSFRDKRGKGIPDYDGIMDAITSISPETWEGNEGPGSIAAIDNANVHGIVISQTWKMHLKIESLLARLLPIARRRTHRGGHCQIAAGAATNGRQARRRITQAAGGRPATGCHRRSEQPVRLRSLHTPA